MWATRIHWALNVLTEMFDLVGMRNNMVKMVSMACQSCHATGGHSTEAYILRMMGEGIN